MRFYAGSFVAFIVSFEALSLSDAMSVRTFKAVIFDYGSVLTDGDVTQVFRDAEDKYNLPAGTILMAGFEGGTDSLVQRLDRGELTVPEALPLINAKIKEKTGVEVNMAEFMVNMKDYLRPSAIMASIIPRLRSAGLRLAILSNSWKKSQSAGDSLLLFDKSLFDTVIISSDVGIRKPDVEIFELTLQELGVRPEEVIFLEDVPDNIEAARAIGLVTIDVDPGNKLAAVRILEELLQLDLIDTD